MFLLLFCRTRKRNGRERGKREENSSGERKEKEEEEEEERRDERGEEKRRAGFLDTREEGCTRDKKPS